MQALTCQYFDGNSIRLIAYYNQQIIYTVTGFKCTPLDNSRHIFQFKIPASSEYILDNNFKTEELYQGHEIFSPEHNLVLQFLTNDTTMMFNGRVQYNQNQRVGNEFLNETKFLDFTNINEIQVFRTEVSPKIEQSTKSIWVTKIDEKNKEIKMSMTDPSMQFALKDDVRRNWLLLRFDISRYVEYLEARPQNFLDAAAQIGGFLSLLGIFSTILIVIHQRMKEQSVRQNLITHKKMKGIKKIQYAIFPSKQQKIIQKEVQKIISYERFTDMQIELQDLRNKYEQIEKRLRHKQEFQPNELV